MWMLSSDVLSALDGQSPQATSGRGPLVNPLVGVYRTKDGRHISLVFLEADRYWADFCRLIGRDDLLADPRFSDLAARREHGMACQAALDEEFSSRTFAEWKELLAGIDAPWAPVQSLAELLDDPQVIANGYIGDVVDRWRAGIPAASRAVAVRRATARPAAALRSTARTPNPSSWTWVTTGTRSSASRKSGSSFDRAEPPCSCAGRAVRSFLEGPRPSTSSAWPVAPDVGSSATPPTLSARTVGRPIPTSPSRRWTGRAPFVPGLSCASRSSPDSTRTSPSCSSMSSWRRNRTSD